MFKLILLSENVLLDCLSDLLAGKPERKLLHENEINTPQALVAQLVERRFRNPALSDKIDVGEEEKKGGARRRP